ncbi:MAG: helix-turn-helix transcriptional regulator [Faecalibacterium sp.]
MQVDPLHVITRLASIYNFPCCRVRPPFEGLETFDYGLRRALDPAFDWQEFGRTLLANTPEKTFLLAEGTFELHFALFRVPDEADTVFMVGPWTTGPRSETSRQWAKQFLGENGDAAVQEYYNGVRIMPDNDFQAALYAIVSTMLGEDAKVREIKEFRPFVFRPDPHAFTEPEFERDIPASMIEQRYECENRLTEAVAHGDEIAALAAIHQANRFSYGSRFSGTLYRQKTKLLILNTVLRRTIVSRGVHPYYVEKISSLYEQKIEDLMDVPDDTMLEQMVRDYCTYVRRYSLKGYSPTVQKVVNYINLNVAAPHTLKKLAAMCHISPTYLSGLFKQETGTTLIDYINTQRVLRGANLLIYTDRPITDIAEEVGFLDVNYFARIFKRTFGTTPTRYRRENHKR